MKKQLLKTKFVCLIIGAGLLIASCGTSNDVVSGGMFSKRKYTKGYHNNFRTNLNSDDQSSVSEKLKQPENENKKSVLTEKLPTLATLTDSKKSVEARTVNTAANTASNQNIIHETPKKEGKISADKTKADKISFDKEKNSSFNSVKKTMKKTPKPDSDTNGLVHIIFIVLLVLLIIALLSFLGGPIGGLLSLVLLILIILLILRLLGVF